MLRKAIEKLMKRVSLSQEESYQAAQELFQGADPHQAAAFLTLLRAKKETADEILGLLLAVREKSTFLNLDFPVVDIVGTGGDGAGTINISTASALLVAACGIPVVKHGNRSVSSQSGSADVLEALGYDIHLSPENLKKSLKETHFGFCFAPDYHPALQAMRPIRKGLKIPTTFHFIGPLLNPAGTDHLLLGVYDPELVELVAEVLFRLGTKKSLVFHGHGIDELSCQGPTSAILVTPQGKERIAIDPLSLGLKQCTLDDLKGKDAKYNAALLRNALSGKPTRFTDTLILNAGAALFIYGAVESLQQGVDRAKERILQGEILKKNYLQEILMRKKTDRPARKSLKAALKRGIIGEIKRASPSLGKVAEILDPAKKAKEYIDAEVSAISVLTDPAFLGSFSDLRRVAAISSVPVLCKDFLLSSEQIAEAALHGADAVLIIVKAVQEETAQLVQTAHLFGMEALVEVHNSAELKIALESNADIIGVNQRDLSDFTMHPEIFQELVNQIPQTKVAESGIQSLEKAEELFQMGYDGVLIGEALSRLDNPQTFFEASYVG